MNENTWKTVLRCESLNNYNGRDDDDNKNNIALKLLKCQGRLMDLSPKEAFKNCTLGHPLPFDRHD